MIEKELLPPHQLSVLHFVKFCSCFVLVFCNCFSIIFKNSIRCMHTIFNSLCAPWQDLFVFSNFKLIFIFSFFNFSFVTGHSISLVRTLFLHIDSVDLH